MDLVELAKCVGEFRFHILGDRGVGKTCIFTRLVDGGSSRWEGMGICVDSELKIIPSWEEGINLEIHDSPDLERVRLKMMCASSERDVDGMILVYDCTNQKSFENIHNWLDKINKQFPDAMPKMLVGNKCDLHGRRVVDYTMAKKYADQLKIPFVETSAVNNLNVKEALGIFISCICEKKRAGMKRKREVEIKEQKARERQEKIREKKELQEWQEQQEKEQYEKECQEKEQLEKNQKYVEQLLLPFLETFANNTPSAEQPLATMAVDARPKVDSMLVKQKENEILCEVERFDCEGSMADISRRWKKWKRTFELYVTAKDITNDERKKATLLYCAGPDVQEIYYALVKENENNIEANELTMSQTTDTRTNGEELEYERAMSLLDKHFSLEKNALCERLNFRNMRQKRRETVAQYAMRLKEQARNCNFGKMLEEQVRDQIVETCRSTKMTKKFIKQGDKLTLEKLLKISTLMENVDREQFIGEINDAVQNANKHRVHDFDHLDNCDKCRESFHAANNKDKESQMSDSD